MTIKGNLDDGFDLFLLGDPRTGWIPNQMAMDNFVRLLEEVGTPRPCIVYSYALKYERVNGEHVFTVGDAERGWSPDDEHLSQLRMKIAERTRIPFSVVRVPPLAPKALEHVCGLQGFGALGDECPACQVSSNVA